MKLSARTRRDVVDRAFRGQEAPVDPAVPPSVARNREKRARQRIVDALEAREVEEVPVALRERVSALVGAWAARGYADAFEEIEQFEVECAREGERARAAGDAGQLLALQLSEHRRRNHAKYGRIEIRGLQLGHRVLLPLEDAFVPLHAQLDPEPAGGDDLAALFLGGMRTPVEELFARESRLLLVGAPGGGKSTLVSWLATRPADGPAFVVLARAVRENRLDVAEVARQAELDVEVVTAALKGGNARLYVDGVDEVRDVEVFAESVTAFADWWPDVRVLVTSRPSGCTKLPGFVAATLAPMSSEDVAEFVDRWCLSAERSLQADRSSAELAARAAAEDLKSRIRSSRPVERLAENPLICGVICLVHRFLGERIPERRVALYEACTNVLLYEWDRAKFPAGAAIGTLDAYEKRRLLSGLALQMHEKRVAELPAEDVQKAFAKRLPMLKGAKKERAGELLAEIRDRSGLLVERSPGVFGFSHLSFQEYLAAVELVANGKTSVLVERADDEWWGEVIVLAAGMPGKHAASLIRGLVARAENADETERARPSVLAALAVESAVAVPVSLRRRVAEVLEPLVPPRTPDAALQVARAGELALPLLRAGLVSRAWIERFCSTYAIARIGHSDDYPRIVGMLHDRHVTVRVGAAISLWERYRLALGDELFEVMLRDPELVSELPSLLPDLQDAFGAFLKSRSLETPAPTPAEHTG